MEEYLKIKQSFNQSYVEAMYNLQDRHKKDQEQVRSWLSQKQAQLEENKVEERSREEQRMQESLKDFHCPKNYDRILEDSHRSMLFGGFTASL